MSRRGAPTGRWAIPEGLVPVADPDAVRNLIREGRPRMVVKRPGLPAVEVPIQKNGFVLGRAPALADLVLDDDLVSRDHAHLNIDPRGYFLLEDQDSRNGITFGGRPVRRVNLRDGDEFQIGRTSIRFLVDLEKFKPLNPEAPAPDSVMAEVDVPEPPNPGDDR